MLRKWLYQRKTARKNIGEGKYPLIYLRPTEGGKTNSVRRSRWGRGKDSLATDG